jgi:TonB family protein
MLAAPGGIVVVELLVGPDGRLKKLRSVEAPHPDFVEAVRRAIQRWRFVPTVIDGQAMAVKGKITYYFSSTDGRGRVFTAAEKTAELRRGE